jgi:hypothetical protein
MRALERQLEPFAAATGRPPFVVTAAVRRDPGKLIFRLAIRGAGLVVPEPGKAGRGRRDGLWRRTCAELFLGAAGRPGYLEWNLSPSGDWNLYRFDDYRAGGRPEPAVTEAAPRVTRTGDELVVEADLPLDLLGLDEGPLEVGVCAVLQAADGSLTHWSLAHPAARPDFHDRRGFVLWMEPASPTGRNDP